MTSISLILFDCDGTLVDSQGLIIACIRDAFDQAGLAAPGDAETRSIIGLSLPTAMARLAPTQDSGSIRGLVDGYLKAFHKRRAMGDFDEPLFAGTPEILGELSARSIDMGIVTGKSRRGLDAVLTHHGLTHHFITTHTGDAYPSKPNPAMVHAALADANASAKTAAVVGDTTFDIQMARAAGCKAVGVSWGYHSIGQLRQAGADHIIDRFDELLALL